MATPPPSLKTKDAFASASAGKKNKKPLPWKLILGGGAAVAVLLIYYSVTSSVIPPQGTPLYGICKVYIEEHVQFPTTMKVIEFGQTIPDGEDPSNPKRVINEVTYSSIDGFGQSMLNSVACHYKLYENPPIPGYFGWLMERVTFNGRDDHGWADVYYPPDKKAPRAADDRNEQLEVFNASIPAIMANSPDLTLPWHDLKYMKIKDLQDL
jgi:hypothetical protein